MKQTAPRAPGRRAFRTADVHSTQCDAHGTWLVALTGDHDVSTAEWLDQQTSPIWRSCKDVIIDLSEADFVDSSIIRWLLQVERELEAAGALTLSVVTGQQNAPAARLFELLRMSHVLACYPTLESALDRATPGQLAR